MAQRTEYTNVFKEEDLFRYHIEIFGDSLVLPRNGAFSSARKRCQPSATYYAPDL